MLRIITILLLCFIVINLFAGLFYMMRSGNRRNDNTVRALTIRVALSVVLFVLIIVASQFDWFPQ